MHNLIKYIFYPEIFDRTNNFNLNVEDYDFLRYWMSRFTYEDIGEKFIGDDNFFETYNKLFLFTASYIIFPPSTLFSNIILNIFLLIYF